MARIAFTLLCHKDPEGIIAQALRLTAAGDCVSIHFDAQTFDAVVTMEIDRQFDQIPDDTYAKIYTAGLLGEQYVGLEPGGSDQNLKDGSELKLTQSALVLEEVIGQFLFSKAQEASK